MQEPIYNTDPDSYTSSEARALLGVTSTANCRAIDDAKNRLFESQRQLALSKPETMHGIFLLLESLAMRLKQETEPQKPDMTWAQRRAPTIQQSSNVIITNPSSIVGQDAPITGGRLATSNDAPPGHINPINVRTTVQLMNLDSRFRDNYFRTSASKHRIVLPEPQKGVVAMRLVDLEIPLTSYAVSAEQHNTTFIITVGTTTATSYKVTLPDGNYELSFSQQSMAMPLVVAMNDAMALAEEGNFNISGGIWTPSTSGTGESLSKFIRFAVDQASGRATFAPATPDGDCTSTATLLAVDFAVDASGNEDTGTNIQTKLGWQLGFRAGMYRNPAFLTGGEAPPSATWSITGEAPVMIQGPRYGFLAIDDHQKNVTPGMCVAFNDSTLSQSVMARFAMGSIITDRGVFQVANEASHATSDAYRTREYFGPVNIRHLDLTLCDEFGRILDLNNCDWSCVLAFEKTYD